MLFGRLWLLYLVLYWNVGEAKPLCRPLLPNPEKMGTWSRFLSGQAPLFFWHIQKAGGTSFCSIIRSEYAPMGRLINTRNQDCANETAKVALVLTYDEMWNQLRSEGIRFVAMEPSNSDYNTFPLKYYKYPYAEALLNQPKLHSSWFNMLHVLIVRAPFETAMSAFNYKFPGMNASILHTCHFANVSTQDCVLEMFRIKENPRITVHPYWQRQQLNRIRTELLGNYTIMTLDMNQNLEAAKAMLHRFHLVVNLSFKTMAQALIRCVLGFTVRNMKEVNVNKISSTSVKTELSPDVLMRWMQYLRHEQQLYGESPTQILSTAWSDLYALDYAMLLMVKHHENATREMYFNLSSAG